MVSSNKLGCLLPYPHSKTVVRDLLHQAALWCMYVSSCKVLLLPNFHLQRAGCWTSENSLQNALTFPKMLHIDISQVLYFPEFLVGNWSRSDLSQKMISSEQIQRLCITNANLVRCGKIRLHSNINSLCLSNTLPLHCEVQIVPGLENGRHQRSCLTLCSSKIAAHSYDKRSGRTSHDEGVKGNPLCQAHGRRELVKPSQAPT